jgi:hypothetical protein
MQTSMLRTRLLQMRTLKGGEQIYQRWVFRMPECWVQLAKQEVLTGGGPLFPNRRVLLGEYLLAYKRV